MESQNIGVLEGEFFEQRKIKSHRSMKCMHHTWGLMLNIERLFYKLFYQNHFHKKMLFSWKAFGHLELGGLTMFDYLFQLPLSLSI
jgi:hypothetical protein